MISKFEEKAKEFLGKAVNTVQSEKLKYEVSSQMKKSKELTEQIEKLRFSEDSNLIFLDNYNFEVFSNEEDLDSFLDHIKMLNENDTNIGFFHFDAVTKNSEGQFGILEVLYSQRKELLDKSKVINYRDLIKDNKTENPKILVVSIDLIKDYEFELKLLDMIAKSISAGIFIVINTNGVLIEDCIPELRSLIEFNLNERDGSSYYLKELELLESEIQKVSIEIERLMISEQVYKNAPFSLKGDFPDYLNDLEKLFEVEGSSQYFLSLQKELALHTSKVLSKINGIEGGPSENPTLEEIFSLISYTPYSPEISRTDGRIWVGKYIEVIGESDIHSNYFKDLFSNNSKVYGQLKPVRVKLLKMITLSEA